MSVRDARVPTVEEVAGSETTRSKPYQVDSQLRGRQAGEEKALEGARHQPLYLVSPTRPRPDGAVDGSFLVIGKLC